MARRSDQTLAVADEPASAASAADVLAQLSQPSHRDTDLVVYRHRHRKHARKLILIAGLPGAGKSTVLHGLAPRSGLVVLDSELQRAAIARFLPARTPYAWYRPAVHLLHRLTVVQAVLGGADTVVVHLPATSSRLRRALTLLARWGGRSAHLVWLEVTAAEALRGQRARQRVISTPSFARHVHAARAVATAIRAGRLEEGWNTAIVVTRAGPDQEGSPGRDERCHGWT